MFGSWWGRLWIWASLVLLIAVAVLMYVFATPYYARLRKAAGLPYMAGSKQHPAEPPVSEAELANMLHSTRPLLVAAIGGIGLVVILALMVLKPF